VSDCAAIEREIAAPDSGAAVCRAWRTRTSPPRSVETRFAPTAIPDFTNRGLSRLNRRAVFGSFFRDSQGIGLRLTFSIYEKEPAANWVASILLQAFGHQLPFGTDHRADPRERAAS